MTKARALIKATSWRVFGSTGTVLTAWWLTGELHLAAAIGGVEFFLKIGMFYLHERLWERVLPVKVKPEARSVSASSRSVRDAA